MTECSQHNVAWRHERIENTDQWRVVWRCQRCSLEFVPIDLAEGYRAGGRMVLAKITDVQAQMEALQDQVRRIVDSQVIGL